MPLIKRILYDSDVYEQAYGELCEDTPPQQLIGNHNMSKILGVLLELSYLTAYSVELFDGLARSADDIGDRVQNASTRALALVNKLSAVERAIKGQELFPAPEDAAPLVVLQGRQAFVPTALSKKSNCAPVGETYGGHCALPPPLWKVEAVLADHHRQRHLPEEDIEGSCVLAYSHPGYFFQEWLRTEQLRQVHALETRRRAKQERRAAKAQRKRERAEAEVAAAAAAAAAAEEEEQQQEADRRASNSNSSAPPPPPPPAAPEDGSKKGGGFRSVLNKMKAVGAFNKAGAAHAEVTTDLTPAPSPPPPEPVEEATGTAPGGDADDNAKAARRASKAKTVTTAASAAETDAAVAATDVDAEQSLHTHTPQQAVDAGFYAKKAQRQRATQNMRFSQILSNDIDGAGVDSSAEAAGALGALWASTGDARVEVAPRESDGDGAPPDDDDKEEEEEEEEPPPPESDEEDPPPPSDSDDADTGPSPPGSDDEEEEEGLARVSVVKRQSVLPSSAALFAAVEEEPELEPAPSPAPSPSAGPGDFLSQIKAGKLLRQAAPASAPAQARAPAAPPSDGLMGQIRGGLSLLKKVDPNDAQALKLLDSKKVAADQNRAAIAGDSESDDDSDNEFDDDDY